MTGSTRQITPPTQVGDWELSCGENGFNPETVSITLKDGMLIANCSDIGPTLLRAYHDGLTAPEWRKVTTKDPRQVPAPSWAKNIKSDDEGDWQIGTPPPEEPMIECGRLPNGCTLFYRKNPVGGRTYYSDEIGGGVMVWDTALVDQGTLLAAMTKESELSFAELRAAADTKRQASNACSCHERDSSFVCQKCRAQGYRGHMEAK